MSTDDAYESQKEAGVNKEMKAETAAVDTCTCCHGMGFDLFGQCPLCDGYGFFVIEEEYRVGLVPEQVGPDRSIVLGTVVVSFLSGQSLILPVHAGESMGTMKDRAFHSKPTPIGMIPQLLGENSVIQGDENAADFVGTTLTALFTRLCISDEARRLLRQCTCRCPEDGHIDLLEISSKLPQRDVDSLLELLVQLQPQRLLLRGALTQRTLSMLADRLHADLEVDVIEIPVTLEGLKDVELLLARCPRLRLCRLFASTGLSAEDVKFLRQKSEASIVI